MFHPSFTVMMEIDRLLEQVRQLQQQRRFAEAVESGKHAVETALTLLGANHPATPTCLNVLGTVYMASGDYGAAEPILDRALSLAREALGEDNLVVAVILDNLAMTYRGLGDYSTAGPLSEQALAIARKTLGKHDPALVTFLNNRALLYRAAGNYHAAEPLYDQALEVSRNALNENNPDLAALLDERGLLHQEMGEYRAAEPLHQEALAIRHGTLGGEHPDVADSLSNLAMLYRVTGDFAAAEPLYQQALTIRRKALGEDHPAVGGSLNNLALLYVATGDYQAAEQLYHQALEIDRKTQGEEHPEFAIGLDNLATLYLAMGAYSAAEPMYRQALALRRKALGENNPAVADSLNNLAMLYRLAGDYRTAAPMQRQALSTARRVLPEGHPTIGTMLNNLAVLYRAMGDYNAAEPLYQEALAIRRKALGKAHPALADTLNNLAAVRFATGDHASAEVLYKQALAIARQAQGEEHPAVADSLSNLAALYLAVGNFGAAAPVQRQALAIRRKVLGEEHPDVALSLNELGALCARTGDFVAAEPLYRQALAIRRKALGEDHVSVGISLNNLAELCAATKRADEARSLMVKASAIFDRMISQVFSISSERQRIQYLTTLAGTLEAFLSLVLQHFHGVPTAVQEAFELVLRRKAIAADASAAQREAVLGGRYPALAPALREVNALRDQIARSVLAGPGKEGGEAHRLRLAEWTARKERLEAELSRDVPEVGLEERFRSVSRRSIAAALPEGGALVEFVRCEIRDFAAVPARGEPVWRPARYLAFVLAAGERNNLELIDLGDAGTIDRLVAGFREWVAVRPDRRAARVTDAGATLRSQVFDPLLPALGGRTRLFLAPDGELLRLPFEVLPTADGRFLIDDYQISYLSVGREVLSFGPAAVRPSEAPLVAVNPDFDLFRQPDQQPPAEPEADAAPLERHSRDLDRGSLYFGPLGTDAEGRYVAGMLGVVPWMDGDVLESRLKRCRSPRVLHLATHGFFLPDQPRDLNREQPLAIDPAEEPGAVAGGQRAAATPFSRLASAENPLLRSGLALAGANTWARGGPLPDEAEDGLFTAEDVSGLDLLATELAVLSACDTGLGEVRRGEGVFGLRRAFVLAGAKTLVMSLWRVPNDETGTLMEEFYRRLAPGAPVGVPRAEALRAAQRALRDQPGSADPYFWGAFICQGDPGVMGLTSKPGTRGKASPRSRPGNRRRVPQQKQAAATPQKQAAPTQQNQAVPISGFQLLKGPDELMRLMSVLAPLVELEGRLRISLLEATFSARGGGLHDDLSPLHRPSRELAVGAPLHAGAHTSFGDRDYIFQVFARDTLFVESPGSGEVQRLSKLIGGRLPASGLGLALLSVSYQVLGVPLQPSDVYHQIATARQLGYPLSERAGTQQYDFQVFSADVLHDCLPKGVPKHPQSVSLLSEQPNRWEDYLWGDVYRALGLPFDPASPFHMFALSSWIGVPLSREQSLEVAGTRFRVQVFTLDTVYIGPDQVPRRMSGIAPPFGEKIPG